MGKKDSKIINKIRLISIKNRVIIWCLIVPIMVFLVSCLMFYFYINSYIENKDVNNYSYSSEIYTRNIGYELKIYEDKINHLINSDDFLECLSNSNSGCFDWQLELLFDKKQTLVQVFDIDYNELYSYGDITNEAVGELPNQTIEKYNGFTFSSFHTNKFILNKSYYVNAKKVGYIRLVIPAENIMKNLREDNVYLILDDNHNNITKGKQVDYKDFIKSHAYKSVGNTNYYFINNHIEGTDLYLSIGYKEVNKLLTIVDWVIINGVFIVLLITILIIGAIFMYKSITKPIETMKDNMEEVYNTNKLSYVHKDGNDEFNDLFDLYNRLIENLNDSLNQVKEEQYKKRDVEIKMLQAQINPHFLFNTLSTLRAIALMNNDKGVAQGLAALAKLLRSTIINSGDYVSVKEEIDNLNNYVIIQKLRYGNSFDVSYEVDENIEGFKIMKFLLQPIVENAILHAFEEDGVEQMIYVKVRKVGSDLEIIIQDNGIGFEYDKDRILTDNLSGIGMKNIQERLKLTFGKHAKMEISSIINEGTKVKILIPMIT